MYNRAFVVFLAFLVSLSPFAVAQADTVPAGTTPDSFLYGLDVALDQIKLLLTFDNAEQARVGLSIARERLSEVREMALQNKVEAMKRGQAEHRNSLAAVRASVSDLSRINSTQEITEEIEIEKELEEHDEEVETVSQEIEVKIKIRGNITVEQQALIDSVLSRLQNVTGEVKVDIKAKKGLTKIKIKQETGEDDEEIDREIRRIEHKKGLTELRLRKVVERMEDARNAIGEAEEKLILAQQGNLTVPSSVESLLEQANRRFSSAEQALNETNLGEAFGQATAAERLAGNAERQLERLLEGDEDEQEVEIEAELKEDGARVEVKVRDRKLRIMIPTTDRNEIISHIADKTGLSKNEVERLLKIQIEDEDDDVRESVKRIRKVAERVREEARDISKDARENVGRILRDVDDESKKERKIEETEKRSERIRESKEGKSGKEETELNRESNSGKSDDED